MTSGPTKVQPRRQVAEGVDIWVISLCGIFPEAFEAELIEGVKASSCPWHCPLHRLHCLVHLKALLSCHPVYRLKTRQDTN